MKTRSLQDSIDKFLKKRRRSSGETYAKVTDKDIQRLSLIIATLVALKFEIDDYGAYPLDWILIDHNREVMHFAKIPILGQLENAEDYERAFELVELNLNTALGDMRLLINQRRLALLGGQDEPDPLWPPDEEEHE